MTHRMRITMYGLMTLFMALSLNAAPVRVIKTDGNEIKGDLISESRDKIVLSISGIKAEIFKSQIKQIIKEETVGIWFENQMSKIKPDDLDAKFEIAQQLLKKESKLAVELAIKLCNDEIKSNDDRRFELLKKLAEEQLKKYGRATSTQPKLPPVAVKRDPTVKKGNTDKYKIKKPAPGQKQLTKKFDPRAERKGGVVPKIITPKKTSSATGVEGKIQHLTDSDINRIKIFELDVSSKIKPKVTVSKDTLEKFYAMFPDDPEVPSTRDQKLRFGRKSGLDKLIAIMSYGNRGTRDLYSEVQVHNDPPVLQEFKQKIQRTVVLNYCGNCHTKSKGGSHAFFLFDGSPSKDEVAYTNFKILDQYGNDNGFMIDRQYPEESMLLRYSLPNELAGDSPHPEVNYMIPLFKSKNDRLYLMTLNWIGKLYNPKPDYGITYESPLYKPVETAENKGTTVETNTSADKAE